MVGKDESTELLWQILTVEKRDLPFCHVKSLIIDHF